MPNSFPLWGKPLARDQLSVVIAVVSMSSSHFASYHSWAGYFHKQQEASVHL